MHSIEELIGKSQYSRVKGQFHHIERMMNIISDHIKRLPLSKLPRYNIDIIIYLV
jgi:hypothetical protein